MNLKQIIILVAGLVVAGGVYYFLHHMPHWLATWN